MKKLLLLLLVLLLFFSSNAGKIAAMPDKPTLGSDGTPIKVKVSKGKKL